MKKVEENDSQRPVTVAVTAVGAIIGQGIVASLRKTGLNLRIIGVDRNPDGLGRYWCDSFVAKPRCSEESEDYQAFWRNLAAAENVDLVLPGLEPDVLFFSRNRDLFNGTRTRCALNNAELVELAQDKWVFGETLTKLGLPAIPACEGLSWQECLVRVGPAPLLLKPRRGNGSRGIALLENEEDFAYWSRKSADGFLVQKLVGSDDEEYTIGAFGLGDGSALPPIIFRRRLSSAGNTQYAEVVEHPVLAAAVKNLALIFKPLGPTNYQFRMEDGVPYLLEINPRFSSSTSLRTAFGYNEARMAIEHFLWGLRPALPEITSGRAWRYSEDYVAL